jgi:hypothetical protein
MVVNSLASNLVGRREPVPRRKWPSSFRQLSEVPSPRADAERVRETIARFQQTYSPVSKVTHNPQGDRPGPTHTGN